MHNPTPIADALNQPPLKVKGSLMRREDILASSVDVFGHLSVRGNITTARLKVSGECSIANACQAQQVENLGSLRIGSLQAGRVISSGFLSVGQETAAGTFQAEGAVRMNGLAASETIEIRLGSVCRVNNMTAGGAITVKPSSNPLNLLMGSFRKLSCRSIEGTTVHLERTKADLVCGEDIVIGPGCIIQEIRYSKSLTVDPKSQVKTTTLLNA